MRDREIETFAVLVAEWVIADEGVPVRLGEHLRWLVRPADDGAEEAVARLLNHERVAAGQLDVPIFVLHADDPEPPNVVVGRVAHIQALQWNASPDGEAALLSQRTVPEAFIDPNVGDYLIQVEGMVSERH